jgi:hypothetical protein
MDASFWWVCFHGAAEIGTIQYIGAMSLVT